MPRPTSPIDDAGPLKGNIPPTLISVGVTPGVSAANAEVTSATVSAQTTLSARNIELSSPNSTGGRCRRGATLVVGSWPSRPQRSKSFSSFFELVNYELALSNFSQIIGLIYL